MRYSRRSAYKLTSLQPMLRALTVISSVVILVTGVTYAALQSRESVLAGNSITTATADLKIGTSLTNFANTLEGFSFNEVVPGTDSAYAEASSFYLKNLGTPKLALSISISTPPTNPQNVDLSKVHLLIIRTDTNALQEMSLSELAASHTAGGVVMTNELYGGATAEYQVKVKMDVDAFSGPRADISGIDLVFNGRAVPQ